YTLQTQHTNTHTHTHTPLHTPNTAHQYTHTLTPLHTPNTAHQHMEKMTTLTSTCQTHTDLCQSAAAAAAPSTSPTNGRHMYCTVMSRASADSVQTRPWM